MTLKNKRLGILFFLVILTSKFALAQWYQQDHFIGGPSFNYPNQYFSEIFFIDANHGWVVNSYMVDSWNYGTTDGGSTWEYMNNLDFIGYSYKSVCFINDIEGWVVCDDGLIVHTDNGGIGTGGAWEILENLNNDQILKVFFLDSLKGWITAFDWNGGLGQAYILNTIDGGQTWNYQLDIESEQISDVYFYNDTIGWAPGSYDIYMSNNGGNTWKSHPIVFSGRAMHIYDLNNMWIAGDDSTSKASIYFSQDGGYSWIKQYEGSTGLKNLNDICFVTDSIGWAVGDEGLILHTSDGGQNWEIQYSNTDMDLRSVCFIDQNNGWICGDDSLILHTNNGGNVGIEETYIRKSKIKIHPNPTRGTTAISFELELEDAVTLSIQTMSGQEIKHIYLGIKSAGYYELNCAGFPPGIYFVTLKTDLSKLTEKLIIE